MCDRAHERMTMVVVTHEVGFVREVAHRVAFIDEGRLIEIAPLAVFFDNPYHERTKSFLNQILVH